jgi:hypothetical protein
MHLFFHEVIDVINVVDDNLSTKKNVAELFVNPHENCAVNEGEIAGTMFGF